MSLIKSIKRDIQAVFDGDPAAVSTIEILLAYPGFHARQFHRLAHTLYRWRIPVLPRLVSHVSRFLTGIEIHPGAKIGKRFFIDHGMGVVIGETADIGEDVLIYQGVVLGGTSIKKGKRHPTLGNNVVVGAGAAILGPVKIGDNSRIGAGSVVVSDVPANSTAVGIPARVGVGFSAKDIEMLEHGKLPDPVADAVRFMVKENEKLEERIKKLESLGGITAEIDKYLEKKKKELEEEFGKPE